MEQLNKWFAEVSESPVGSIVLFIMVFMARVTIDQWSRKRERKRKHRKGAKAHG